MFKTISYLLALLTLTGWVGSANATLIGDSVDAGIFNSSTNTRVSGFGLDGPFTAEIGAGDAKIYSDVFSIDFESNGFSVDYILNAGWSPLSELRVLDLDWVGMPSGIITGLTIGTNLVGWEDSSASFTDHAATFAWGDLQFTTDSFLNVTFQTNHAVPAPTTILLFGFGLAGLGWSRRKKA